MTMGGVSHFKCHGVGVGVVGPEEIKMSWGGGVRQVFYWWLSRIKCRGEGGLSEINPPIVILNGTALSRVLRTTTDHVFLPYFPYFIFLIDSSRLLCQRSWCTVNMYYPVCSIVHIKVPLVSLERAQIVWKQHFPLVMQPACTTKYIDHASITLIGKTHNLLISALWYYIFTSYCLSQNLQKNKK